MDYLFLIKCFGVGLLAASSVGPLFILIFNRAAFRGFLYGWATALGAAIGDGIFFCLASIGVLNMIKESFRMMILFDFLGGSILLLLAYRTLCDGHSVTVPSEGSKKNLLTMVFHALLLTLVNPATLLYFMVVAAKILPDAVGSMVLKAGGGSITVMLGALTAFTGLSIAGTMVGHSINRKMLRTLTRMSGTFFAGVGLYLFYRVVFAFLHHMDFIDWI